MPVHELLPNVQFLVVDPTQSETGQQNHFPVAKMGGHQSGPG